MTKNSDTIEASDPTMQRFLRWLDENGANLPSLTIDSAQGIRGVRATERLVCGELAAHIPVSLLLTLDVAKASPIGQLITAHKLKLSDFGHLAAFLLDSRQDECFWKPYVDMLPSEFSDHPFSCSDAELHYLKGSYIFSKIVEQRNRTAEEWRAINSCLPAERRFSLHDFTRARCAAASRTHSLVIDGAKTKALVPFADMFNHSFDENIEWDDDASRGFSLWARVDIDAGTPVHVWYGQKCNAMLFYLYGFCLDKNPYNMAEIELPELATSHPYHAYTRRMGEMRDTVRVFALKENYKFASVQAMFSYLRLAHMADMPGKAEDPPDVQQTYIVTPLSRDNETATLVSLADACRKTIARFDTTIDEDDALLARGNLPLKLRNAVIVRREEKRILQHYLDLAHTVVPLLRKPLREIASYEGGRFASYCFELVQCLREREQQGRGSAHK